MEDLLGKYKAYLFILLGVIVAIGVWWGLSGEPASDTLITTENVSGLSPTEKSLVDTLLQLRAVSLGGAILTDPAFMVLRDFGTQIVPEPVGRENPFAPISAARSTSTAPAPAQKSSKPSVPASND